LPVVLADDKAGVLFDPNRPGGRSHFWVSDTPITSCPGALRMARRTDFSPVSGLVGNHLRH
jgi:hypothetical protein